MTTRTEAMSSKVQWVTPAEGVRLACADWLDAVRAIEPGTVDLVYTDPPFNTGQRQTDRAGAFEDSWPDVASYVEWMRTRLLATLRALKPSGSILLHVDWRTSHHVRLLLDELLGVDRFVNHLVWSYGLGGSSPRRFARKHDDILFYCLDPETYYFEPPMIPATSARMAGQMKKATDVLDIPSINNMANERVGWPTQKPLALLEVLIGACCPPAGVVLDPCCGSGTTLVAARRCARQCIGADINPDAIAMTTKRITDSITENSR